MERKYDYKQLDVYQDSKKLVLMIYELLRQFPKEEQFALCDQLRRAVISIPSNLAEGCGRISFKEQAHFIEIAYGSLLEVECQIDIARELAYVSKEEKEQIDSQINKIAVMFRACEKNVNLVSNPQPSTLNSQLSTCYLS